MSLQTLKKAAEIPNSLSMKWLMRQDPQGITNDDCHRPTSFLKPVNLKVASDASVRARQALTQEPLSVNRDISTKWVGVHPDHISSPPAAVDSKPITSIGSASHFSPTTQSDQMPIFQTDAEGRLVNGYTRGLVLRELMSHRYPKTSISTLECNPPPPNTTTHRHAKNAAGRATFSHDSGITDCAANTLGSAHSPPPGLFPTALVHPTYRPHPVHVDPIPSPDAFIHQPWPNFSAALGNWTTDELAEIVLGQTSPRVRHSLAAPSDAAQLPFERQGCDDVESTCPTHGWPTSSGDGAAAAPVAALSGCLERDWPLVQHSEDAQFVFLKNLFARKPAAQDSISQTFGMEAGGSSRCQSSQLPHNADLAAMSSPSVAYPSGPTEEDFEDFPRWSSGPPGAGIPPPHPVCPPPPPFPTPKSFARFLGTDTIRSQISSVSRPSTVSGQKRSFLDRVQFDWLEGDVARSWQNEWNAKVAKVATLRDQRGWVGDGRNGVGGGGIGGSGVGRGTSRGKSEQREGFRFKKIEIPILGHSSHNAL